MILTVCFAVECGDSEYRFTVRMRELDRRVSSLIVRHCDSTFPRIRFPSGVSSIAMFTAKECYPLIWSIVIALGADRQDEVIISREWRDKTVACFHKLLYARYRLTKSLILERELPEIDRHVKRLETHITFVIVLTFLGVQCIVCF